MAAQSYITDNLSVISYNCEGFKRSCDYIGEVLNNFKCDIICLQETWLLEQNLCNLSNVSVDYLHTGKSGVDSTADILQGRPSGGVSILYKKSISKYIKCVHISSNRVCGVILNGSSNFSILVLCVYMPCDTYSNTHVQNNFSDVLGAIECAVHEFVCDGYVICGDFNTSFERENAQSRFLLDFIKRNNFHVTWDSSTATCDYTYTNHSLNHKSIIDHFVVSSNIFDFMSDFRVHYDATNPSNHNVLKLELKCDINNVVTRESDSGISIERCAWHKATQDNIDAYKNNLDILLSELCIPNHVLMCHDVLCKDSSHRNDIDKLCSSIIQCCLNAGKQSIPSRVKFKHCIPGWKEYVKPERERSLFWHWIWLESDKPNNGYVYDIMKKTRSQYHYAVRYAKKNEFNIKKQKLAESISNNSNMWKELKKINPNRRNMPSTVDNACGADEIAELFVTKYEQLLTSVPTDKKEMNDMCSTINKGLNSNDIDRVHLSVDVVAKCILKLKSGKSDGGQGFDSDHLLNGTPKLYRILCILFNCMVIHGHTANDLLYSTIISIPKNLRASLCSSDNYRGIALCSSICKVLDLVILDRFSTYLYTSDLQFGFKPGHSTTLCTAVYVETVDYYLRRNSDVFSCLLDASKAFDRVHYGKLFKLLMKRNLPLLIVRLLYDNYTRQVVSVFWDNSKSRVFGVTNGVKQGGVLSPILFIVYIDELLTLLRKSNLGCHVGSNYIGALGYADDITLISPSLRALNEMLSICTSFAEEYNVTFNADKTVCIKFGSPVGSNDRIYLDKTLVKWVDHVQHLGNTVNVKLNDDNDCEAKRHAFNASVNTLLGNYGGVQSEILCRLFRNFCCSFYGSQLWDLQSSGFHSCCVQWNKAVRRLLRLPYRTHTWLLGPLIEQPHIRTQLAVKTLRFVDRMINSPNNVISVIGNIAKRCALSPIGKNIAYLKYKYNIHLCDKLCVNVARIRQLGKCNSHQQALLCNMQTLINVKNGLSSLEGFDTDMVESMLYSISCD